MNATVSVIHYNSRPQKNEELTSTPKKYIRLINKHLSKSNNKSKDSFIFELQNKFHKHIEYE